jgi:hypothetical protein
VFQGIAGGHVVQEAPLEQQGKGVAVQVGPALVLVCDNGVASFQGDVGALGVEPAIADAKIQAQGIDALGVALFILVPLMGIEFIYSLSISMPVVFSNSDMSLLGFL